MKRQTDVVRHHVKHPLVLLAAAGWVALSTTAIATQAPPQPESLGGAIPTGTFSPYAGRNFPTQVFWGDTHLHTAVSVDAGTMCRVGQEDAFRFASGEEITTTHGLRAKLSRPLDCRVI